MTIRLLLVSCLSFLSSFIFSQQSNEKMGIWNKHLLDGIQDQNSLTEVIVKGNKADIQRLCTKYHANYLYSIGPFQRVSIAVKDVSSFASESSVERLGNFSKGGQALLDTSRILVNVDSAYLGYAPLTHSYTGEGVIMGLVDDGIDPTHLDFQHADGTTRIKFLWDQNIMSSLNPMPYTYGKEWNFMEINAGLCTHQEQGSGGHGTHVAGIAAGNGNDNPMYRGNAPKADMIVVSVKYGNDFLTNLVDAIDYIFKKADALGKPCVINTSVGEYYGSRDGKDVTSQAIEYLLDERPGRVVVAAAGNAGNIPYHAQFQITAPDTSFIWFKDIAYSGKLYYDFWADTQQLNNVYFTTGAIEKYNFTKEGNIGYLNVKRDLPILIATGNATLTRNIINSAGRFMGQVKVSATLEDRSYHFEFEISPDSSNKYYSLSAYGNGKLDVWASSTFIGTSNIVTSGLPSDTIFPEIIHYVNPDINQTLVSNWQCSNKVITVGNYTNRSAFLNYDSAYSYSGATPGMIDAGSSLGPTRDGRTKPDLTAPGGFVVSCGNLYWSGLLISTGQTYKVAYGGHYVRNTGTSMASPMVAGAVALLLEKYPNLDYAQTKELLFNSIKKDTFTTPSTNNTYGHGKLNTFQALIFPAIFGCIDSGSFNYNPLANIDDYSCIAKVFGCTDTGSINYNALANTNDGSCILKVYGCLDSNALNYNPLANISDTCIYAPNAIPELENGTNMLVYPNPATNIVSFSVFTPRSEMPFIIISDHLGKTIQRIEVKNNLVSWSCENMARGIYYYVLRTDEQVFDNGKLVLF